MSPSAMALIGLFGTSATTKSMPVLPLMGAGGGAAEACADIRACSSGEMPWPGWNRFTMPTPIITAMIETTTV